jgi:hypothetical protein
MYVQQLICCSFRLFDAEVQGNVPYLGGGIPASCLSVCGAGCKRIQWPLFCVFCSIAAGCYTSISSTTAVLHVACNPNAMIWTLQCCYNRLLIQGALHACTGEIMQHRHAGSTLNRNASTLRHTDEYNRLAEGKSTCSEIWVPTTQVFEHVLYVVNTAVSDQHWCLLALVHHCQLATVRHGVGRVRYTVAATDRSCSTDVMTSQQNWYQFAVLQLMLIG